MKLLLIFATSLIFEFNQTSKIIFDIPALKNKSIVEIRKILGKPKIDDVPLNYKTQSGVNGDAWFEKDGVTLEITYNPVNNKVNDFFICKDQAISDYKLLEIAGNVLNTKEFILTPVNSGKNPSLYTGVTVTPK
ncbi:hypothetical protein [Mucilaginibacter sp. FT3.2]|uniref:hypothetical protein n=1 Tax=Mucilaginibacter sp. FT3.2 TaxID=2723090 RepID=UPI00160F8EFF|nr:hypothetical protein [Mucilaginibacter sp. FT3.2]MBB6232989.1 hypothetical protein [Mucilaginibacter sp. FT3.2]